MIPALILALMAYSVTTPAAGTYAITQDAQGLIRMDTRTGAMERCAIADAALKCEPLK